MPSQANSGAIGLSDCDSATRPQAKPPYGQTLADASRAIQSPATTSGQQTSSRASGAGPDARHPAVGERDQRRAPSAHAERHRASTSADHGTGPRKSAAHSMCGR